VCTGYRKGSARRERRRGEARRGEYTERKDMMAALTHVRRMASMHEHECTVGELTYHLLTHAPTTIIH
jgi:hypothetical protein